jgi:hypothetical protein
MNKKASAVPHVVEIPLHELIDSLVCLGFDEVIEFIKKLDEACQDWDVTETLHDYFVEEMKKLHEDEVRLEELEAEERKS